MKQYSLILSLLILIACSGQESLKHPTLILPEIKGASINENALPFINGIASGDPTATSVIVWTRVTPPDSVPEIEVQWSVFDDKALSQKIKSGIITTGPERDYTVKIDVTDLQPGRFYYYQFSALNKLSPIGRTKTIATDAEQLNFAVVSCSNWEWGYFNGYAGIAQKDLDAVLHLGDYIYEYGIGSYGDTTIGRINYPPHEIVSLNDYRQRHFQYRLDEGLQAMTASHPLIAIWDDHEIANDAYSTGAQNHQTETEGDYAVRMRNAVKAYYEWLPIREGEKLYRSFDYGDLADVIMLDERLEGRTRPPENLNDPVMQSEEHSMLGQEQLGWLFEQLDNSASRWKIIGNQVIFSDFDQGAAFPNSPRNLDSWDGYPNEKKIIANHIINKNIKNIVFLTGDTHASWAFEVAVDPLKTYDTKSGKGAFAIELGTPSISSSNYDEYTSKDTVMMVQQMYMHPKVNPHLKYVDLHNHGYLLLKIEKDTLHTEWIYNETVREPSHREFSGKKLKLLSWSTRLID
ncbi:MAG TPA: alkaline phosphatase D family protein [Cyclobacteriaceae bacterium]|nr:alkaline phosphatase D family protein [Cyclobacteriaceae bacterium]